MPFFEALLESVGDAEERRDEDADVRHRVPELGDVIGDLVSTVIASIIS